MGENSKSTALHLTGEGKRFLLGAARKTLEAVAAGDPAPDFSTPLESLKTRCGAFVTLRNKGELRGCIGYIRGIAPLLKTVVEMAEAAALRDPRFEPVRQQEVPDVDIEISVLSPLEKCTDLDAIEVGRHGLLIEKGFHSGLLLPQVAVEYEWDRRTFLEQTCLKAGLPTEAYKDKETEISVFYAEVFGEKELDP